MATGVSNVNIEVDKIDSPKVYFPPYLVTNDPAGK